MNLFISALVTYLVFSVCIQKFVWSSGPYEPTWESLDSRPLPEWFDDSKIGIFIHWGVFSVPSYVSEWFWYYWKTAKEPKVVQFMNQNYKPNFTYADFAAQFTAEFYDPKYWAELFKKSGAKYVVLTSKHHEGYTMWPSKVSWNWNSMDVGPKRDLVHDLSTAVRDSGLKFGLYHSLFEWFNRLYLSDQKSGFKQQDFPKLKTLPELYEIVNTYKPEVIWSDGEGDANDDYWNSRYFLQWLYNESPVKDTVVTNDRWGTNTFCKHGGYWTCTDRFIPGKLLPRKWENAMTLDKSSWGYNRLSQINDYLTIDELLKTLAQTISFGGNLLVNVGPTSDGRIVPIMEERLLQMGEWLQLNGKAIYKSKPWKYQNDTKTENVWYTADKASSTVYAIFFNWPENNVLSLASIKPSNASSISLITKNGDLRLKWTQSSQTTDITLPIVPTSKWAWTLKIDDY